MHIQDTFHPDGLPYESIDDFSETESERRLSEEKLDLPTKDQYGKLYK
jgi:hypothetical protein